MKSVFKKIWYVWAKSLGNKAHEEDRISDLVAIIRSVILFIYVITNFFIIAGIIKHWNN